MMLNELSFDGGSFVRKGNAIELIIDPIGKAGGAVAVLLSSAESFALRDWLTAQLGPIKPPVEPRKGYLLNCYIKPKGEQPLFLVDGDTVTAQLDGYAIIPIEEYEAAPVQECVCGRPDDADEPEDRPVDLKSEWHAGYMAAREDFQTADALVNGDDIELNTTQNLRVWGVDQSTSLNADEKIDDAAKMVAFVLHGEAA